MSLPRFGVRKPVPVNLLMLALLIGGLVSFIVIRREFFPEVSPDSARISLSYPGASPEEIEQTLARKIEDALLDQNAEAIDELRTTISEGGGGIIVIFREGLRDLDEAITDIKQTIDSLQDLPVEADEIIVSKFDPLLPVVMLTIFGDVEERTLKQAISDIRDDLRSLPGMGDMVISGVRDYEVRVDVRLDDAMRHGIAVPQVADAIRRWMADIPGGTVRSPFGNTNVRTLGTDKNALEIGEIVVVSSQDGQVVQVRDVADVRETFVDEQITTRFNGKPAATITVFKKGDQDVTSMAGQVKAYADGKLGRGFQPRLTDRILDGLNIQSARRKAYELGLTGTGSLPLGTDIAIHSDLARFVEGRLDLLARNALYGAMLVFGTLFVFLNWRTALWVGAGLTTALAGTLILMISQNITLNLLTMFGLIIVIGLLVDDAIVVAENIQSRHDRGEPSLAAAINGANQVAWPVVATVLTSIVAFLPLSFVRGRIGDLLGALPLVVACALIMSLIESLLILPSHLGHSLVKRDKHQPGPLVRMFSAFEKRRDAFIFNVCVPAYSKLLQISLRFRYVSVTIAISLLIFSMGMVQGERIVYRFLPSSDSETIIVDIRLPVGTSVEGTAEIVQVFEAVVDELKVTGEVKSVSVVIGQRNDMDTGMAAASATHLAQMFIELTAVELRDRESAQIITSIREMVRGKVDRAERVSYSEISGGPGGSSITIELRGDDPVRLQQVADVIKDSLGSFQGVYDIADNNSLGQKETQIRLKPSADRLGFNTATVSQQVRGALFGIDAHVFQDLQEDIDVRVRLDERTRGSLQSIETMWLVNPEGLLVPLTEIAELSDGTSYATINRIDRRRSITVTADTAAAISPQAIVSRLPVDEWRAAYPDVDIVMGGQQDQQMRAFASLPYGFGAALLMVYVILAWLFSSYTQPLAVMLAIPFGIIGVIWGHYLLDYELTFLSMIGFVALSGIVVNDSLILVKFYNDRREDGLPMREAIIEAGERRLRPIFLTTITTVLGLTPLMLEQSFQAKFLIPMAISISAGLVSATVLILLVLPCLLTIVEDVRRWTYFLWHGQHRPDPGSGETVVDALRE